MKISIEQSDYDEIRDEMEGVIEFVPTDREIDDALFDTSLAGDGLAWGWSDTEVRTDLAHALERVHAKKETS